MRKPDTLLIIATILLILAFFAHTFGGDLELQLNPQQKANQIHKNYKSGR